MLKNLCLRQLFSFSRNKRFIGGNWKSNNTLEQSKKIIKETINQLKFNHDSVDVIVAPVCLHISTVKDALLYPDVKVAAQNCSSYNFGAYTGQTSAKHLKDMGLQWVILGHSQRRTIFKESDDLIVSKTKLAIQNDLKVIYCFGQTLQERKGNKTWEVLQKQLVPILKAYPKDSKVWQESIVFAYEPVWAIGTGINSSPQQTKQVFDWLRNRLSKDINNSDKVRIIYGGSANKANSADYLAIKSLDGLLVGGASLKPEFADMIRICQQAK